LHSGIFTRYPHLAAALIALIVCGIGLAVGITWAHGLEFRYVHALAADLSEQKLQGVALQKAAFSADDLLLLYGSSELVINVPNKASSFFYDYPTGFRVFSVGKAGTTALGILQKLGALGPQIAGRKVAISISPSSYFVDDVDAGYYGGSFSDLQASQIVFSSTLSPELKRDIARRMLEYPKTLDDHWILRFAIARLARNTIPNRLGFLAITPLGKLQNSIALTQDHFESVAHILRSNLTEESPPKRKFRTLKWNEIFKRSEALAKSFRISPKKAPASTIVKGAQGSQDRAFLQTLAHADEWTDCELLLRTLRELKANPLLISMPIHGQDLETSGVSLKARDTYIARLQSLANSYQVPLVYYKKNEDDPTFFVDEDDHLGVAGWVYYNQTLDSFFHDQLPSSPKP